MSILPEGLDPEIRSREIVFEADVSLVTLLNRAAVGE
jgi:hypothetical protein